MNARMPHLMIVMLMQAVQILNHHIHACAMMGTLVMEPHVMVSLG